MGVEAAVEFARDAGESLRAGSERARNEDLRYSATGGLEDQVRPEIEFDIDDHIGLEGIETETHIGNRIDRQVIDECDRRMQLIDEGKMKLVPSQEVHRRLAKIIAK